MVLSWPEELGDQPQAWVWFMSAELDKRDTSFKLDAAQALIDVLVGKLLDDSRYHRNVLMTANEALLELGIPSKNTPAPITNAVALLDSLFD